MANANEEADRQEPRSGSAGAATDPGGVAPEWRITPKDWDRAVQSTEGPQLLVAGPGAGKSEFLVRRATHLINDRSIDPGAVLTLTFSRRAAADLRDRILDRIGRTVSGVPASTFHSFAARVLEVHGPAVFGWTETPTILTGPEQISLIGELLTEEDEADWPLPFRPILSTNTLATEVADFVLRSRERLLEPSDLVELATDRDDWQALPALVERYEDALNRQHRVDYGTLQARAVQALGVPAVASEVADQYQYVLVDEYQDTTLAQAELLANLSSTRRNLLAAADPYQSVYGFRGTELHNVEQFPERFRDLDDRPARRMVLATSFRVPAEILRAAERVTSAGSIPGAAGPVEPAPHVGRVDVHVFDQHSQEADWIASEARRLHIEHGIAYRDIAVLVRTKQRLLPELSRALDRRAIPHEPPDARLSDHPAIHILFDIVRAAAAHRDLMSLEPDHPAVGPIRVTLERAIRRLLLGPLLNVGISAERALARQLIQDRATWPELLAADLANIGGLIEDAEWLQSPAVDAFWLMWTSVPEIGAIVTDPARGEFRAAWTSLAQVLGRLNERDPSATLLDYVRRTDADEIEATPLLSFTPPRTDQITLTTLHQSKGLEFEVVFISDAVEGVFPDLRRRRSLLGTERLAGPPGDAAHTARLHLHEEMRLAYTAMTRARTRVVWTATQAGLDEGQRRPSRFLAMVADVEDATTLGPPDAGPVEPVTIGEAEARLRSILTDPAAPAAQRLAAASVLVDAPTPGMRSAEQFTLVRRSGSDRGILPPELRLSPSQADAYETCPRRYALERRLRVAESTSVYAVFGTMIHEVLETAERLALAEGRTRSSHADAAAVLSTVFETYDFGDGAWREAWRRRADGLLASLYSEWPRPDAEPVLLEHHLSLEIDGIEWRGIADRVERDPDGTLRVVDYKTSKNAPPRKDAALSLQLGFYVLSANSDKGVTEHGQVDEAEFWYPMKQAQPIPFDSANLGSVRARLSEIAAGIAAEEWPATPNRHCEGCAVKIICPEWPEGRAAFVR